MLSKKTDFEQVRVWVEAYNKYKQQKRKKQLLTLIVFACEPFVKSIAYNLARRSTDPVEDIIQVGNIGLMKAVQRYKSEHKNIKNYIKTFVIGEIKHYLRDKVQTIKAPRELIELSYRINNLKIDDIEENYKEEQRIKKRENKNIYVERRRVISLDQIQFVNDENSKIYEESLSDDKFEFENSINKILLKDAIEKLSPKLKEIIKLLYFENIYQTELAKKMNTSQSNISRLQKRALKQLFDIITSKKNED